MKALELVQNVTLLVTLCVVYRLASRHLERDSPWGRIVFGLLFGGVAVLGMMSPWQLLPGVVFDGRSVLVSLAGVFGGTLTAGVSALITAGYRLYLGGDGAWTGCGVIASSALLGIAVHQFRRKRPIGLTLLNLYLFGLVVHLVMLGWMLTLPGGKGSEVLRVISLPVLLVLPATTMLVGWVLVDQDEQRTAELRLRRSEERFRTLYETMAQGVIYQDAEGRITSANPAAERLLGLSLDQLRGRSSSHPEWRAMREDGSDFPGGEHPAVVALRTGAEVANVVMGVFNPRDQSHRWLQVQALPQFRPGEPRPFQVVSTFTDITPLREREREIQRLNRLYAALSQVNQAIVRGMGQDELLPTVCRAIVEFGQFRLAAIGEHDTANQCVRFLARHGADANYLQEVSFFTDDRPEAGAPTSRAIREGRRSICNDYWADSRMAPFQAAARRYGFRASASFPIHFQGKVWGVLSVYESEAGFFRDKELKLLEETAGDIAFALEALAKEAARRTAESALAESEQRFRLLYESSPVPYQSLDADGNFVEVNNAWLRLLGYDRTEVLGHWFGDFLQPKDIDVFGERFPCFKRLGEVRGYEFDLVHKDGQVVTVSVDGQIGREPCGAFRQTHCVLHNITERKRAEEKLRESESRFRGFFEQAAVGMCIASSEGRFLRTNRRFCEIVGYSMEELLSRDCVQTTHPADREREAGLVAEMLAGERQTAAWEKRYLHRSGATVWCHLTLSLLRGENGQMPQFIGVIEDITARKQAEEALQASEKKYRTLVELTHDLVWEVDREGRITYMSPAARRIYGRTPEEMVGRLYTDFVPEEEARRGMARLEAVLASGEDTLQFENRVYHLDGHEVILLANAMVARDESGQIIGTVGTSQDITEQKRAETELRESEQRFRSVVESAPEAIFIQTHGCFAYVNAAALKLFGASSPEQLVGEPVLERFHPDCRDQVRARIRTLNEKRQAVPLVEEVCLRLNGEPVDVEVVATPFEYLREEGALVFARDITDRKEARAALHAGSERLRLALAGADLGTWDWDVPSGTVNFNERWAAMLGYSLAETSPQLNTWESLVHEDDLPDVKATLSAHLEGRSDTYESEHRLRHKSGHWVWVLDRGRVIERDAAGNPLRVCGTHLDITERKRAEAALRASEASLVHAQQIARVGNWDWNIVTDELYWSAQVFALFGISETEADRTYERFLQGVHPEDRERTHQAVQDAVAGRAPYDIEHRVLWPDGTVRVMHERGEVTRDAAGRALHMTGTVQDITSRKLAEQAVLQSRQQLRALTARVEKLREEERARIAREIHDELGQMLTGIKMDLRWMEHRLDALGDDRRVNPILDKLVATGELTDATVKTVQRIAAELRPGILDKLGLPTALEYEAAQFEARAGVKCRVTIQSALPPVNSSAATAFFRIFQEALTNVIRHAQATAVEAELCLEARGFRLEIRDNGRGITAAEIAKPTALGLLGMQERARLVGGDVSFGARTGGGTVVTVQIPNVPNSP